MDEERCHSRRELMAPYEHPYRHALIAAWRHQGELRLATDLGGVLWLGAAVAAVAGAEELALGAAIGASLGTIAIAFWLVAIVRLGRRMTRTWDKQTELGEVRARRPQAGTEDAEIVHDEFAVTVQDDGRLVTWRFRPLPISEHPADNELEIPGRPRYAVSPVDDAPFDTQDTVRASEQLVLAQTEAARREAASAEAAGAAIDAGTARAQLEAETRSTVAALRRATGQRE